MKIGASDTADQIYIIAEIGNNHEGSFTLAKEMIHSAVGCGVSAVKFQTIVPELLVQSADSARRAQLGKFRFSYDQFALLKDYAVALGVDFISTPFDLESAKILNDLVPAFKIASGDNTFFPLIEYVVTSGKPVLLSTGLLSQTEMKKLSEKIAEFQGLPFPQNISFLHCVVSYPTPEDQANLRAIEALKQLPVVPGYSDHVLGITACQCAAAMGARVLEKHFTLNKKQSDFRDHQLSADPGEMKLLVDTVRSVEKMLGKPEKFCGVAESANLQAVRRSVACAADLPAGHVLSEKDFIWVRPGTGYAPGEEKLLIGKKLKTDLLQGEILRENHFTADN